jgi:hypothetical protein
LADLLSVARETLGTRAQASEDGNPGEEKGLRWGEVHEKKARLDSALWAAAWLVLDAGAGITGGVSTFA